MSKLDSNTAQLKLLLEKVNVLPPAGSGGIDIEDALYIYKETTEPIEKGEVINNA